MLKITKTTEAQVSKIECPLCGKRVPKVGLLKGSHVEGFTFKCSQCGNYWEVQTTEDKK